MASDYLVDLAQRVSSDVGEHSATVEAISGTLRRIDHHPAEATSAVFAARDQLVAANAQLQLQLERAERQVQAQCEQLRARESEARTDLLTNLANRRMFDDEMRKRLSEWERKQIPFALLMLDIDHFKRFNDTYGHLAGDEVLRNVAKVLVGQARDMDVACRYGGEEFAVILPATRSADACIVAERIRKAIELSSTRFNAKSLKVTTSVGVAAVAVADRPTELVRRADDALYQSKKAGRNCVHCHNGETCAPVVSAGKLAPAPADVTAPKPCRNLFTNTGESNRELARLISVSHRLSRPLSIMCITLSDGDALTRRHGEFVVGRLLDMAIQSLMPALGDLDSVCQTAIDELIALFPGRSKAEMEHIAGVLQFNADNMTFRIVDRQLHALFHFGICQLQPNETVDELLFRARKAMFAAGTSGPTVRQSG